MLKRKYTRIHCNIDVKITTKDEVLFGKIYNLGAGGCRIAGENPLYTTLKENDIVEVEFWYTDILCTFKGRILRDMFKSYPISIEFIYTDEEKDKLNEIISKDYLTSIY